jgi:hypothetical protein
MTKMNPDVKAVWIEALRSGNYQQGRGVLTNIGSNGAASHCCLGVLCQLYNQTFDDLVVDVVDGHIYYNNVGAYLPNVVADWSGLTDFNDQVALADRNDGSDHHQKHTFAEIADYVEENL